MSSQFQGIKGTRRMTRTAQRADVTIHSAFTDVELHDWLRWAEENGSSFPKATADAGFIADLKHYNLLRPVLLELKKEWPRPA